MSLFPLSGGRMLPLYRCFDPLSQGVILAFTDPAHVPVRGDWVVVGSREELHARLCRYDPSFPVPEDSTILGVPRMLCVDVTT